MAIIFDEISAEVAPERGADRVDAPAQAASAQTADPAELVRREVQRLREREMRLVAD